VLAAVRDDFVRRAVDFDPIIHIQSAFEPNSPQLFLNIDRDKAMRMGVNLSEVFATLQSYLGVAYVNDFNILGRTFRVNMQAKGDFRNTEENMMRIHVRNMNGEMVPLSAFTTLESDTGPQSLTRYNMFPSVKLMCIIRPDRSSGEGIQKMEELSRDLPDGFTHDWTALAYEETRTGNQMIIFFFISFLFCFLILAALYESWSAPLIIMMAVPLGIVGAFAAVLGFAWWAGNTPEINVYTQIGLMVMIGLSAKNAVLIVEFARANREQGVGLVQAAYEAGQLRVRPIFVTSFAFILGMLPLRWADGAGSNARNAIGNGLFGGLITETIIGIYVTPVLFVLIQGASEFGSRRMKAVVDRGRERTE
jgi:multidrug efflux pump subunit AcrB